MSDENKCTTDTIYPFMCTHQTSQVCMDGCNHNTFVGSKNCNDCLWLCFPFTMALDILSFIPFTGIYICKKTCCRKTPDIGQTITIQPY
jgi:hypothetical protein